MTNKKEFYIVIDVETSGPNPGNYDLLSIGACTVNEVNETFYIELIPKSEHFEEEAMGIHNLSFVYLNENGVEPKVAIEKFEEWIKKVTPSGHTPVFAAFNAPFDWLFMTEYFYKYLGRNPFGHKALDIKALYMGLHPTNWLNTSHHNISMHYHLQKELSHHALEDAIEEAEILSNILDEINNKIIKE
jgi:DNA polymerase III epsilon subunit-like protein